MRRGRGALEAAAGLCGLFVAAACGSSSDRYAPGSGGIGGSAGSGGATGTSSGGGSAMSGGASSSAAGTTSLGGATPSSGGVAGTSGAANGAESRHSACVKYLDAECNRQNECRGIPLVDDPCPSSTDACPDFLFADGSSRTLDNVVACTAIWKTYSCSEVNQGHVPDCVQAGTRASGEPCLYSNQCASGICNRFVPHQGHPQCSVCVDKAAPGETCSELTGPGCPPGYNCSCPVGSDCNGRTTCIAQPPAGQPLGASCVNFGDCYSGTTCVSEANDPTHTTCQKAPAVGESCAAYGACTGYSFCNAGKKCEPFPGAGNPCTLDPTGNVRQPGCAADAFCNAFTGGNGQCIKRPAQGEHCHASPGSFQDYECTAGLFCVCDDAACATGTCLQRRDEGQSCGAANARCALGTSCEGGVCVAQDSQGRFAQVCLN